MRGLQPPPKEDSPSRVASRFFVLILLAAAAGLVIYTAVTNQRVDLTEDIRTVGLDLDNPAEVGGLTINVDDPGGSAPTVVLLHDVDIAGGLTLGSLADDLSDQYRAVRIDLPGFGYSDRMPSATPRHTAAGMAETVSEILAERYSSDVIVVGAGFGGDVAAELAHSYPDLVSGVVLVDVEFDSPDRSFQRTLQRLPWIGKAATYTWETGGRFALDNWSPYCDQGGWCPTPDEASLRAFIVEIEDSTVSLHEFLRTNDAALAPGNLDEISIPVAYVWSTDGPVNQSSVDSIGDGIPGMTIVNSDTFQAHLEDFDAIRTAIEGVSGN